MNMLNRKIILIGALAILIAGSMSFLFGQSIKLGKFTLPRDVEYNGKTISKGEYQLSLETSEEKTFICISNEELLAKEMAIIQEVKKNYPQPVFAVDVITQDKDQFVRISIFKGQKVYKAFYKCI